jgi:hypothetical protein
VYDPPAGFIDLLADAEDYPITGETQDLDVPRVGVVKARKPMPRAAAALAMTAYDRLPAEKQLEHFTRFVTDHIGHDEYERLLGGMLAGELPSDAIQRTARAVATWGTARPYTAVVTLSLHTGYNWRTIRHKLVTAGIAEPMALGSLHKVLDVAETIVVEGLYRSAEKPAGPPSKGELKVQRFFDLIYAPEKPDAVEMNGEEYRPIPVGFEDPAAVEASFDAFLSAAH